MLEILTRSHKTQDTHLDHSQRSLMVMMKRKDVGFLELPYRVPLWNQSVELAKKWRGKFKKLAVIGIGGSSLGAQCLLETFHSENVIYFDNLDNDVFSHQLQKLGDLSEVAWAVASKSGTTLETLTILEYVVDVYEKANIYFFDRAVAITENNDNSLASWARENQMQILEVPLDVGGRYSVLSPVGIFPCAFAGINVESIRQGALAAQKETALLTQIMGQVLQSFERKEWITMFWFYSSRMRQFGMWVQQLWAESLGKRYSKMGEEASRVSTPLVAIGACDQHSLLQQVMEGARDKFNIFFEFPASRSLLPLIQVPRFKETRFLTSRSMQEVLQIEAKCTQEGLAQNQIATMYLRSDAVSEFQMGFLLMFFEILVAGLGEALNLNAFDQPGVELGKRLAREKLIGH